MSDKSKSSNKSSFEYKAYELSNETHQLEDLEQQIQYYSNVKHKQPFSAWTGVPPINCGLSLEEFEYFRSEIISILKGFYNKRLEKNQKLTDKLKLV